MVRWFSFLLVAACARPVAPEARPTPGAEGSCGTCHADEVADWEGSMHHASFTSEDFQRSYRAEPRAYCVDCHAPVRMPSGARDLGAGIGCTTCHAVADEHLTRATGVRARAATKPCAGCHDFDAPGTAAVLQSTAREHAMSRFASVPCASCHMPERVGGHRDHRFLVSRDPAFLARAIRIEGARIEGSEVVVRVASRGVGHRFPTGDIYRRLTVTLTAYDTDDALVAGETAHFHRDWDAHRAALSSRRPETLEDLRLENAPREVRAPFARAPARVHVTVDYARGAGGDGEHFEAFETLPIFDADVALEERSPRDNAR